MIQRQTECTYGKIENEYKVLGGILDRAWSQRGQASHPRVAYILNMIENNDGQLQAIKELIAVSKEADSDAVFKEINKLAGVTKLRKIVDKILDKIAEYFNTKTADELLKEVDTYTLHDAVQNIRLKAREDKGVVKADNAIITELKNDIPGFCS
jgi:uncharacterized protein YjgD (DUF1641 family)